MKLPDWRNLQLADGVFREPSPDESRLVLWARGDFREGFHQWERIANVPGAEVTSHDGLFTLSATVIRARQEAHGWFGKLLHAFRKPRGVRNWLLPRDGWAEQVGERLTDRVLVWADNDSTLREQDLNLKLGPVSRFHKLATNLFVAELAKGRERTPASETPPEIKPLDQAKKLLDAARNAKDCPKQASALIDLGVIHLREGQVFLALDLLTRALTIARKFNDAALISDAQTNLAKAFLAAGHADKARELLKEEVANARASADRFHEKLVLGYLAGAHAKSGDRRQAVELYEAALELARQVGDWRHQADLLWQLAIQNAESGEREQALTYGLEAAHIMEKMGNPSARESAKRLEEYRLDVTSNCLQETAANGDCATRTFSGVFARGRHVVTSISKGHAWPRSSAHGPICGEGRGKIRGIGNEAGSRHDS